MREGKTINELAATLQDMQENSRDFIVPTAKLELKLANQGHVLSFENGDTHEYGLNNWSDRQLATYTEIPQSYYDRIKTENSVLFADNVNHGLRRQVSAAKPGVTESRMLRTYRGNVRALVSSRYRRLDCYDLLETIAPIAIESGLQVVSSEITDKRMYLQMTTERLTRDVKVNDPVQYGLIVSGSDVGAGAIRVEPMIYRLLCLNGMIASTTIRKFHIGKNQADDEAYELLTDSTKELTDAAFWAQVKDIVTASLRPEIFEKEINKLRSATEQKITNFDLPQVVELAAKHVGAVGEGIKQNMIAYLANGADGAGLTKWGLANAFTWAANSNTVHYDDAVELERAGAKIIDLTVNQWKSIAAPAA